jgi:very-short-patch-repair endonuclease
MADERARKLRKNATESERRLWIALRTMKTRGLHFRRQAPIGPYIVDFVCHRAKLIVELDGGHHADAEQKAHDDKRTAFLESVGYRVHRFWNVETFKHEHDIADAVFVLAQRPPPDPASPDRPPLVGGGEKIDATKGRTS